MWCDEESKLRSGWQDRGNPYATQEWQDSAAYHMGWEWLHANYGGFIWDHDIATGKVVQIVQGQWEEEGRIENSMAIMEEDNE